MRRTATTLTLTALLLPALTGCVFMPAVMHQEAVPDEDAFINAVAQNVNVDTGDEWERDLYLDIGYQVCDFIDGGMRPDAIIDLVDESDDGARAEAEVIVEAAQDHLC